MCGVKFARGTLAHRRRGEIARRALSKLLRRYRVAAQVRAGDPALEPRGRGAMLPELGVRLHHPTVAEEVSMMVAQTA